MSTQCGDAGKQAQVLQHGAAPNEHQLEAAVRQVRGSRQAAGTHVRSARRHNRHDALELPLHVVRPVSTCTVAAVGLVAFTVYVVLRQPFLFWRSHLRDCLASFDLSCGQSLTAQLAFAQSQLWSEPDSSISVCTIAAVVRARPLSQRLHNCSCGQSPTAQSALAQSQLWSEPDSPVSVCTIAAVVRARPPCQRLHNCSCGQSLTQVGPPQQGAVHDLTSHCSGFFPGPHCCDFVL